MVAVFGGIPFVRESKGQVSADFHLNKAWWYPASARSEVVDRLLNETCELCGAEGPVQMHHIRKLADLNKPGRKPKAEWEKAMIARKRKTLAVCENCHNDIHAGRYDGTSLRD